MKQSVFCTIYRQWNAVAQLTNDGQKRMKVFASLASPDIGISIDDAPFRVQFPGVWKQLRETPGRPITSCPDGPKRAGLRWEASRFRGTCLNHRSQFSHFRGRRSARTCHMFHHVCQTVKRCPIDQPRASVLELLSYFRNATAASYAAVALL